MALGLAVGDEQWQVGSPDELHAFFSTLSVRLEPLGWGTRFPALMNDLYQGDLPVGSVETALSELLLARRELATYPVSALVWDADDPQAAAPVRDAANLAKCFHASDGRDLFDVLMLALVRLRSQPAGSLRIVELVAA